MDDWKLEEFLVFSIAVAGKTAKTIAPRTHSFLMEITNKGRFMPLLSIRVCNEWGTDLGEMLQDHGIGCYTLKAKSLVDIAERNPNLRTCSVADLEACYGIGPKTARFFVMHSRRDAPPMAALDTHILKYLREQGVEGVPKETPSAGPTYNRLEQAFLELVPAGVSPADWDLEVWKRYRA
jgi:thermostable 8-oxoguanine DNA glycosylase